MPETGIKDGLQEMELEFSFATVRPEKQDYFFRCSVASGNFPLEWPKSRVPFTFQLDFPEPFCKLWTNPFFHANQCEKKDGYRKLFCQPTWLPCGCKTRVEGFALFVWLLTAYSDSCLSYGRAYEWFPFFKGSIIYISSHQSNSKNNAPVSLFKTILRHSTISCRLSQRMARMDMEIGPTFWHFVWGKGTK